MKFILRNEIPTLQKGESAICIDSLSVITYTEYEGFREQSLKDFKKLPVVLLTEIKDFLNETHTDVKAFSMEGTIGDIDTILEALVAPTP